MEIKVLLIIQQFQYYYYKNNVLRNNKNDIEKIYNIILDATDENRTERNNNVQVTKSEFH